MKNIFIATDVFVLNIHHDKITNYTPAENANCFFILCVRNIHLRPLSVKMTSHLSTMSKQPSLVQHTGGRLLWKEK